MLMLTILFPGVHLKSPLWYFTVISNNMLKMKLLIFFYQKLLPIHNLSSPFQLMVSTSSHTVFLPDTYEFLDLPSSCLTPSETDTPASHTNCSAKYICNQPLLLTQSQSGHTWSTTDSKMVSQLPFLPLLIHSPPSRAIVKNVNWIMWLSYLDLFNGPVTLWIRFRVRYQHLLSSCIIRPLPLSTPSSFVILPSCTPLQAHWSISTFPNKATSFLFQGQCACCPFYSECPLLIFSRQTP